MKIEKHSQREIDTNTDRNKKKKERQRERIKYQGRDRLKVGDIERHRDMQTEYQR